MNPHKCYWMTCNENISEIIAQSYRVHLWVFRCENLILNSSSTNELFRHACNHCYGQLLVSIQVAFWCISWYIVKKIWLLKCPGLWQPCVCVCQSFSMKSHNRSWFASYTQTTSGAVSKSRGGNFFFGSLLWRWSWCGAVVSSFMRIYSYRVTLALPYDGPDVLKFGAIKCWIRRNWGSPPSGAKIAPVVVCVYHLEVDLPNLVKLEVWDLWF